MSGDFSAPAWFTVTLLCRTLDRIGSCQTQPPQSTVQAGFPSRPYHEHIWDLRWAIWSLSEDWCEVLVKFKMISVPWAARNNEVLIGMLSSKPRGSLTRQNNINKHKHWDYHCTGMAGYLVLLKLSLTQSVFWQQQVRWRGEESCTIIGFTTSWDCQSLLSELWW